MNDDIISLWIILKSKKQRKKEIETEKINYASGINSSHKALIRNILENDTHLKKTTIPSKNKILVIEKNNGEILPFTNINRILNFSRRMSRATWK